MICYNWTRWELGRQFFLVETGQGGQNCFVAYIKKYYPITFLSALRVHLQLFSLFFFFRGVFYESNEGNILSSHKNSLLSYLQRSSTPSASLNALRNCKSLTLTSSFVNVLSGLL